MSHYKFSFIGPKPPTAAEERNQGVFFRFLIALFSYVALQGLLAQRHQLPLKKWIKVRAAAGMLRQSLNFVVQLILNTHFQG